MARIALLTKKISPQALGLAQALQFHRHEVTLITSAYETVPDNLGYQVLTYFKTWSAVEAIKFFPRILGQAPDVWHFVFADTEIETPTPAHWILALLARALPGRVVAASFYDSVFEVSGLRLAPLLKNCDIVTTATRENLMYLKRRAWLQRFCETEVLPPFMLQTSNTQNQQASTDQDLTQLTGAIDPYIVIPSEHLPDLEWDQILGSVHLVICGQRPELPMKALGFQRSLDKVYFVGHHLSDDQMSQILKKSLGLLTAFDDFSIIEQLHYHRLCLQTKTPVIANARQVEALPGFCVHKRNGFVLDQGMKSLRQLLHENPRLELSPASFEPIRSEVTDSALNELNRLYSKIRHMKSSAFDFKRSPTP